MLKTKIEPGDSFVAVIKKTNRSKTMGMDQIECAGKVLDNDGTPFVCEKVQHGYIKTTCGREFVSIQFYFRKCEVEALC